ncbi:SDR family oxidoreductase [Hymenobacter fodinae]|uniref:SDR family NAD(P)-dependent oxidoreductase n=1 Tax=Hymenobacter fodinae TaxID=2510796 RepID=A0A4Z0P5V9_9BACT|nr:SDR family oxidoreductase [Hymenobacter fodinae]TGE06629.1 SDR family NAD(P)-dependent oxidoreductase [Hymenobacter fodinae]
MNLKLKPLHQQTIVITGASSGIGLVTARMAAKKGARVVLAARNADALRQLAHEINSQGGQALAVPTDVGSEEMMRLAAAAQAAFGGFDTWVNNAGVSIFGHCDEVSIPDMERMFATNFWGTVYGSRLAVQHYKQRREPGALINIGSFFGDRATPVQSTYCASKHALHGWTNALRMELEVEKAPVSVTLIHPGRIDTPYNEHAQSYFEQQVAHRGMVYPPEAVAEAILFAAAHPKRDMYVGFQAKALTLAGHLAPRIMDKVMEALIYPTQLDPKRPSRNAETSALYKAGYGLHERGSHEGWFRSRSLYVKAEKHPLLAAAAVAGLSTAAWLLTRSRSASSAISADTTAASPDITNSEVDEPVVAQV